MTKDRTFSDIDADVQRAATEALAGTGVVLEKVYPSGRAVGICENKDAYEIRLVVTDRWTRIVSRQEISGMAGQHGRPDIIAEVNKVCADGLADISTRAAAIAKATSR